MAAMTGRQADTSTQPRTSCSALSGTAATEGPDLALLIQLTLLWALQGDEEVRGLVCHGTVLVQHHTEALQSHKES